MRQPSPSAKKMTGFFMSKIAPDENEPLTCQGEAEGRRSWGLNFLEE